MSVHDMFQDTVVSLQCTGLVTVRLFSCVSCHNCVSKSLVTVYLFTTIQDTSVSLHALSLYASSRYVPGHKCVYIIQGFSSAYWESVRVRANLENFASFFVNFGKECVAFIKFHKEELSFWYLK